MSYYFYFQSYLTLTIVNVNQSCEFNALKSFKYACFYTLKTGKICTEKLKNVQKRFHISTINKLKQIFG